MTARIWCSDMTAAQILQLIALGWFPIESDGDQMTIQAPEDWTDDELPDGERELLVDTARLVREEKEEAHDPTP